MICSSENSDAVVGASGLGGFFASSCLSGSIAVPSASLAWEAAEAVPSGATSAMR